MCTCPKCVSECGIVGKKWLNRSIGGHIRKRGHPDADDAPVHDDDVVVEDGLVVDETLLDVGDLPATGGATAEVVNNNEDEVMGADPPGVVVEEPLLEVTHVEATAATAVVFHVDTQQFVGIEPVAAADVTGNTDIQVGVTDDDMAITVTATVTPPVNIDDIFVPVTTIIDDAVEPVEPLTQVDEAEIEQHRLLIQQLEDQARESQALVNEFLKKMIPTPNEAEKLAEKFYLEMVQAEMNMARAKELVRRYEASFLLLNAAKELCPGGLSRAGTERLAALLTHGKFTSHYAQSHLDSTSTIYRHLGDLRDLLLGEVMPYELSYYDLSGVQHTSIAALTSLRKKLRLFLGDQRFLPGSIHVWDPLLVEGLDNIGRVTGVRRLAPVVHKACAEASEKFMASPLYPASLNLAKRLGRELVLNVIPGTLCEDGTVTSAGGAGGSSDPTTFRMDCFSAQDQNKMCTAFLLCVIDKLTVGERVRIWDKLVS